MSLKYKLISIVLALPALAGDPFQPILLEYHQLQTALAGDDFSQAKAAVKRFRGLLGQVQPETLAAPLKTAWKDQASRLKTSLVQAGKAPNLKHLRENFETVSTAVIALSRAAESEGFQEFRCPMAFDGKGADWLQRTGAVRNPYFGAAMLSCGFPVPRDSASEKDHHHRHHQP